MSHSAPEILSFDGGYNLAEEVFIIAPVGRRDTSAESGESTVLADENLEFDEMVVPPVDAVTNGALRFLARWLLSAARKGAPVVDSRPVEGSQNRLDVRPGAKVGSDGR